MMFAKGEPGCYRAVRNIDVGLELVFVDCAAQPSNFLARGIATPKLDDR
jgi:hypothetical protein